MNALAKNRPAIMIIILFVLIIAAYNLFFAPSDTADLSATPNSQAALGADLLKMSQDLSRAALSQDIFKDPGYRYLIDFTTPIPLQPVGRANPFETIGRE